MGSPSKSINPTQSSEEAPLPYASLSRNYGNECCSYFLGLISEHPEFYTHSLSSPRDVPDLPQDAQDAWTEMLAKMKEKYKGVTHLMCIKFWRTMRALHKTPLGDPYRDDHPFLLTLTSSKKGRKPNLNPTVKTAQRRKMAKSVKRALINRKSAKPVEKVKSFKARTAKSAVKQGNRACGNHLYMESLRYLHGRESCNHLIKLVSKHPELYTCSWARKYCISQLPAEAQKAWKVVIGQMKKKYPKVNAKACIKFWRNLRNHFKMPRQQHYRPLTQFLYDLDGRQNRARSGLSLSLNDQPGPSPLSKKPGKKNQSAAGFFEQEYGRTILLKLFNEISKFPDFFAKRLIDVFVPNDLKGDDKGNWKTIITALRKKYPKVTEYDALKAWLSVRKKYFSQSCKSAWKGQIEFLNEWKANRNTHHEAQDNQADQESQEKPKEPSSSGRSTKRAVKKPSQARKSGGRQSAVDFFDHEYGRAPLLMLFNEIEKIPEFYAQRLLYVVVPSDLKGELAVNWRRIITALKKKYPKVTEFDALKAWLSVRKNYFYSSGSSGTWNRKLEFLNRWQANREAPWNDVQEAEEPLEPIQADPLQNPVQLIRAERAQSPPLAPYLHQLFQAFFPALVRRGESSESDSDEDNFESDSESDSDIEILQVIDHRPQPSPSLVATDTSASSEVDYEGDDEAETQNVAFVPIPGQDEDDDVVFLQEVPVANRPSTSGSVLNRPDSNEPCDNCRHTCKCEERRILLRAANHILEICDELYDYPEGREYLENLELRILRGEFNIKRRPQSGSN
ncbi:hypothetical protein L596_019680 [Steinernema carpocapsae]|uniref:MADF domain-containing protein n=1 Tax=Steinernema carpocapsae TaxID=34508 RepID=A0A4U5MR97_STECR|nr:hypothetical protein L596_019680 [Steinernema carpocapsae]